MAQTFFLGKNTSESFPANSPLLHDLFRLGVSAAAPHRSPAAKQLPSSSSTQNIWQAAVASSAPAEHHTAEERQRLRGTGVDRSRSEGTGLCSQPYKPPEMDTNRVRSTRR